MESRILCFKFLHIGKKPSQRYCLQLNLGFSKKMAGKWDLEKSGLDSGIHTDPPTTLLQTKIVLTGCEIFTCVCGNLSCLLFGLLIVR
jgi:hypothetical protein